MTETARSKRPSASRNRPKRGISAQEVRDVEELSAPRSPVIYEVVRRLGEEELERPTTSLWWSGIAAGVSMSFSLMAMAVLEHTLPDAPWRPLVASFGYCVGFLMAVMGRQQLFTESTITVVLPVLNAPSRAAFVSVARLWLIVLAANLAGTLCAALVFSLTPMVSSEMYGAMVGVSRHIADLTWTDMFFRAVASGFLIAAMVWMIPTAENAQFMVITLMTWLIAIGGFTHIVAGSMEAYLLVIAGDWAWWQGIVQFFVPVLLGNMVGGTALFAMLSYAQVMEEI